LVAALVAVPILAQHPECGKKGDVSFAPKKGQWEFSLVLGGGDSFYNENTGNYLLPSYTTTSGSIGLTNGSTDQSGYLNDYLNIGGFNNNSLVNIVGLQAKYFVSNCWAINFSAGLNIGITPKKDYIEEEFAELENLRIPDQKYVNAEVNNNWYVNFGVERYYRTSNRRIHPYAGAVVGFQMARIDTKEPYTGTLVEDSDFADDDNPDGLTEAAIYLAPGKVGQMMGIKAAAVFGIEYALGEGLYMGLECQPLAYRYDIIQIAPQGFDKYNLSHHNIKVIDAPQLKIGFRF
jgi:hypothetical protein